MKVDGTFDAEFIRTLSLLEQTLQVAMPSRKCEFTLIRDHAIHNPRPMVVVSMGTQYNGRNNVWICVKEVPALAVREVVNVMTRNNLYAGEWMTVVYNMDCMEYMKTLPDNAFDLAVVDPPYGNGVNHTEGGGWSSKYRFGGWWVKYNNKKANEWDVAPSQEYFDELFRASKAQVIWGGNYFALPPCRCFLVWQKLSISEKFSMAMCEYAWTSFSENAKLFACAPQGTVRESRIHPTQKPVALYKWILGLFAQNGMRILDTHVGSGSSRIACYDAGIDFVGCEIDKGYFEAQEERFGVYTSQNELFAQSDMFTGGIKWQENV